MRSALSVYADMETLKREYLDTTIIKLTCKYGLVRFRGTLQCAVRHRLVFETNDAMEAVSALETLTAQVGPGVGFMIILNGVGL